MRRAASCQNMNETSLLHTFMAAVPHAIPSARVFRRNIINAVTVHNTRVRNGIKGQADAYCLVRGGLHIEIEAKSATGRLTEAQVKWQSFCLRFDIPHLVLAARKNESPIDTVARWVSELRTVVEAQCATT